MTFEVIPMKVQAVPEIVGAAEEAVKGGQSVRLMNDQTVPEIVGAAEEAVKGGQSVRLTQEDIRAMNRAWLSKFGHPKNYFDPNVTEHVHPDSLVA